MQTLVNRYRDNLLTRNFSQRTIEGHLCQLGLFIHWLRENGIEDISEVNKNTIKDYQTHLFEETNRRGRPNTVSTQNVKLGVVKSFFRYLRENDYTVGDPAREITYAKTPKRLPRSILTPQEVKKLLKTPDTKTVLGYRDRAILELLYCTGIRRAELYKLQVEDVDYNDGFLRINDGKGGKDRVVPLGKIACRYLENYIKAIRPVLLKDPRENTLFLSNKGARPSNILVPRLIKVYARKAKIKKTVSPHTFRHTCATHMLRNKANIRHVQEILGHACLSTTQIYTHVSITDLKEVHRKCHPREKDTD